MFELQGGIILGPSFLGRAFPRVEMTLIPPHMVFVAQTLAWLGIMQVLFSVSAKMDFTILVGRGWKAFVICIASIGLPFVVVLFLSFLLHDRAAGSISGGPFLVGMAASIAASPFLVVYQFLSEFQLLTSELGRLSLAIALLSDVISCIVLVYVDTNSGNHFSPMTLVYQLGALTLVALILLLLVRPFLFWVVRQTPPGKQVQQGYVVAILVAGLLMGVGSSSIGLSVLEGPIFFGIAVPDGPPLGSTIAQKTETMCRSVFMPFFFYYVGQRFDLLAITDWSAWRVTFLLILVNRLTKLSGTIAATIASRMAVTEALMLGLILSSRGFTDLLVYSLWYHYRVGRHHHHHHLLFLILKYYWYLLAVFTLHIFRMFSRFICYPPR